MTKEVFQIRIALVGIFPPIWRRIQIPSNYSFWELHVAIQNAMGWYDSHPHAFRVPDLLGDVLVQIGIPDDEFEAGRQTLPGWDIPVADYLSEESPAIVYQYDFGDGWVHVVQLEARLPAHRGHSYPVCLDGERKCPPEDCGGIPGYELLLAAISDRNHPQHDSLLEWVGGSFDAEEFEVSAVRFDDPTDRWKETFGNDH